MRAGINVNCKEEEEEEASVQAATRAPALMLNMKKETQLIKQMCGAAASIIKRRTCLHACLQLSRNTMIARGFKPEYGQVPGPR